MPGAPTRTHAESLKALDVGLADANAGCSLGGDGAVALLPGSGRSQGVVPVCVWVCGCVGGLCSLGVSPSPGARVHQQRAPRRRHKRQRVGHQALVVPAPVAVPSEQPAHIVLELPSPERHQVRTCPQRTSYHLASEIRSEIECRGSIATVKSRQGSDPEVSTARGGGGGGRGPPGDTRGGGRRARSPRRV
eukprot:COSAG06_NODE_19983_length_814_cov_1.752448_1_plen_190_part_01